MSPYVFVISKFCLLVYTLSASDHMFLLKKNNVKTDSAKQKPVTSNCFFIYFPMNLSNSTSWM